MQNSFDYQASGHEKLHDLKGAWAINMLQTAIILFPPFWLEERVSQELLELLLAA